MKRYLYIVTCVFCCLTAKAQDTGSMADNWRAVDSICIYYRTGYRYVEPGFRDNRKELDRFIASVRQTMERQQAARIIIQSGASPDGTNQANERLSQRRADSVASYICRHASIPDAYVEKQAIGIAWERLRRQVAASDMAHREEVLDILDNTPLWSFDKQGRVIGSRKKALMDLRGGVPYRYMYQHLFPDLRCSVVAMLYVQEKEDTTENDSTPAHPLPPADSLPAIAPVPGAVDGDTLETDTLPRSATEETAMPQPMPEQAWIPRIQVKTNAIGWVMMVANASVEIDLSRRFSINLPFYYSGLDYFTRRAKFRILATQPELRFWFAEKRRVFVGAHFGVASYNFALGGKWRIQDHNGTSPALGGGISAGYKIPFTRNERFCMEFSAGAGVYKAHYDKFNNEKNGAFDSTVRKTFIGLDHAAVSFSYSFDLKKRK